LGDEDQPGAVRRKDRVRPDVGRRQRRSQIQIQPPRGLRNVGHGAAPRRPQREGCHDGERCRDGPRHSAFCLGHCFWRIFQQQTRITNRLQALLGVLL